MDDDKKVEIEKVNIDKSLTAVLLVQWQLNKVLIC